MDGFYWKILFFNRWFGGTPISGNLLKCWTTPGMSHLEPRTRQEKSKHLAGKTQRPGLYIDLWINHWYDHWFSSDGLIWLNQNLTKNDQKSKSDEKIDQYINLSINHLDIYICFIKIVINIFVNHPKIIKNQNKKMLINLRSAPKNMWTWKTVLTIFKSSVGLGSTKTKPRWTDLWLCWIWRFPCGTNRKSSMFIGFPDISSINYPNGGSPSF